jgi:hypothetical protein
MDNLTIVIPGREREPSEPGIQKQAPWLYQDYGSALLAPPRMTGLRFGCKLQHVTVEPPLAPNQRRR